MNVKELMEILKKEDPEKVIILSSDPEGNMYRPVSSIRCNWFYDGDEAYDLEWDADEANLDEDTWEEFKEEEDGKCIVFFPID